MEFDVEIHKVLNRVESENVNNKSDVPYKRTETRTDLEDIGGHNLK